MTDYVRVDGTEGCPGCTEYEGEDGRLHPYGPHVEGCKGWESDAINRMQTAEWLERKAADDRAAIADGCGAHGCKHPLPPGSENQWRALHEFTLANTERLIATVESQKQQLADEGT